MSSAILLYIFFFFFFNIYIHIGTEGRRRETTHWKAAVCSSRLNCVHIRSTPILSKCLTKSYNVLQSLTDYYNVLQNCGNEP